MEAYADAFLEVLSNHLALEHLNLRACVAESIYIVCILGVEPLVSRWFAVPVQSVDMSVVFGGLGNRCTRFLKISGNHPLQGKRSACRLSSLAMKSIPRMLF